MQPVPLNGADADRFWGHAPLPWNPVAGPEVPLLAHISAQAARWPQRLAVVDDDGGLTYAALLAQAAALAAAICRASPPGGPIGLRLADTRANPVALLATLAAGRPAILLDANEPADRLAQIVAASRMALLVSDAPLAGLPCLQPFGHPAAPLVPLPLPVDAPAFVIWTSGSTGQPKGIVHSQRSVAHRAGLLVNTGRLGPEDALLSLNTACGMGGLLNAMAAFIAGATLHRVEVGRAGLSAVLRRVERHGITAVVAVPALYRALARVAGAGQALHSLRWAASNGEALMTADLGLLRQVLAPGCILQMVYGATECQAAMLRHPLGTTPATPQMPVGWPVPGTRWAILDEAGEAVPAGEAGELVIESRYTAMGEWRDGACVPGRMLPLAEPGWRRYRMGDLVRQQGDGCFLVLGRLDRQVKVSGYRIELAEIEAALRRHAGVLDAAVLATTGAAGPELVGFVAAAPSIDWPALRASLTKLLPGPMRPRRLHRLERLPLLAANKIDTGALLLLDARDGRS